MSGRLATGEVRQRYDEMAGRWRMRGMPDAIIGVHRLRRRQFRDVTGDVLDVACGTGENFKYLRGATKMTALDLSSAMVAEARRRAGHMKTDIEFAIGDAQHLPFPDRSFDNVVSAFSSCTFPDYVAAFREMARVVKPGGRLLLVEHGRSSVGWIARRQDRRIDVVYERAACRNNRDVASELGEAGLRITTQVRSHLGMMSRIAIQM